MDWIELSLMTGVVICGFLIGVLTRKRRRKYEIRDSD